MNSLLEFLFQKVSKVYLPFHCDVNTINVPKQYLWLNSQTHNSYRDERKYMVINLDGQCLGSTRVFRHILSVFNLFNIHQPVLKHFLIKLFSFHISSYKSCCNAIWYGSRIKQTTQIFILAISEFRVRSEWMTQNWKAFARITKEKW